MPFARRNQCFARIIHANFIFGGQPSVFRYPHYGLSAVSQDAATGTFLLQLCFRELPCAGRWREMCLRPEYFLFVTVPLVSSGGIAAGQGTGSRPVLPCGQETVLRMRRTVFARLQPRQILSELRRCHEAQKRRYTQAETASEMSRFRGEKSLVNQGLLERCQWGRDTFPIHTRKTALKGVQKPYQTQRRTLCQKIASIIT